MSKIRGKTANPQGHHYMTEGGGVDSENVQQRFIHTYATVLCKARTRSHPMTRYEGRPCVVCLSIAEQTARDIVRVIVDAAFETRRSRNPNIGLGIAFEKFVHRIKGESDDGAGDG